MSMMGRVREAEGGVVTGAAITRADIDAPVMCRAPDGYDGVSVRARVR